MTKHSLTVDPGARSVEWFEESIPVRSCRLTLENIKEVYLELSRINRDFGQHLVAELNQDEDMSDDQWIAYKKWLLADAFKLTVSITGLRDQRVYAEDADIFTSANLPNQIKSIYFNNVTAFSRNSNGNVPLNKIEVTLDFDKPAFLDPNLLASQATPNNSFVQINATDVTYFRAVQQVIVTRLINRRTWYGFLHKSFAYDLGMWLFALPVALFFSSYYTDRLISMDSKFAPFRWALFIYVSGMMLILYRLLSGYTKWAFPVNVLAENKDKAVNHRFVIGGFASWLFYRIADTLYTLIMH